MGARREDRSSQTDLSLFDYPPRRLKNVLLFICFHLLWLFATDLSLSLTVFTVCLWSC